MNRKMLSLLTLLLMGTLAIFAQSKTEKFEVRGNCGMCETRIEKAANNLDGVTSSDWDNETGMMTVSLDEGKTNVHKVQMAIAKAGHDTEMHPAPDEVYEKLPGCCKYDRMKNVVTYEVFGMDCPGCQSALEKRVNKIDGVIGAKASFKKKKVAIELKSDAKVSDEEIEKRIKKANFTPGKKINNENDEE